MKRRQFIKAASGLILPAAFASARAQGMLLNPYRYAAAGGSSFPTTSLIAFYKMDEASGNALDASGNSRTFTQTGTVGASSGTIGGASVATRSFTDPSLNYFERADDANFDVGTGDFTVSAWVKVDVTASGEGGIFCKRNGPSSTDAGYSMGLEPFGSQIWTMSEDTVCDGASDPAYADSQISGIATGEWHHYVWVFTRSGSLILYVDGVSSGKTVVISGASGNADNSVVSQIGRITFNNAGAFKGELTHLGFWKKALDSTERGSLYNTGHVLAP